MRTAIILCLYNNAEKTPIMYSECLRGFENQTLQDFIVVAVDDHSTDNSVSFLKGSSIKHKILRNKTNLGFTRSLIRAVNYIKSKLKEIEFIAIQDADDYSLPTRIGTQVSFFDEHPEVDLVGSNCLIANQNNIITGEKICPETNEEIYEHLRFRNPLIHSTMMMRRSVFNKVNYDPEFPMTQDYHLWTECAKQRYKFSVIPNKLVVRCKHRHSIGGNPSTRKMQKECFKKIRDRYQQFLQNDQPEE